MSQEFPEVRVGVLGATGDIGAPCRAEMRKCAGVPSDAIGEVKVVTCRWHNPCPASAQDLAP